MMLDRACASLCCDRLRSSSRVRMFNLLKCTIRMRDQVRSFVFREFPSTPKRSPTAPKRRPTVPPLRDSAIQTFGHADIECANDFCNKSFCVDIQSHAHATASTVQNTSPQNNNSIESNHANHESQLLIVSWVIIHHAYGLIQTSDQRPMA